MLASGLGAGVVIRACCGFALVSFEDSAVTAGADDTVVGEGKAVEVALSGARGAACEEGLEGGWEAEAGLSARPPLGWSCQ